MTDCWVCGKSGQRTSQHGLFFRCEPCDVGWTEEEELGGHPVPECRSDSGAVPLRRKGGHPISESR